MTEILQTPLASLISRAERTPQAAALIAGEKTWTCGELVNAVARLNQAMQSLGVRQGDRVALHMFNIPELAVAYCACWSLEAIAVPLNARFKSEEIQAMIDRVQPVLYMGQGDLYRNAEQMHSQTLPLASRIVTREVNPQNGIRSWDDVMNMTPRSDLQIPSDLNPDAPAVLLATSGTTGPSKLVVWTPRILASLMTSAKGRGVSEEDVVLINTPMMHGSGVYYLSSCFLTGAVAVLVPQFEPDTALDAIEKHHCSTFFGLPFMCSQIIHRQREQARDLRSLSLCTVAGDVCPSEVESDFGRVLGKSLVSFWAAAEDVGATIVADKPGPLMRPLAEAEWKIVDDAGDAVSTGESGELILRSPTTTSGYWNGPDSIDPLPEGWFHSGDLVRVEPDGHLRYMGRKKDLIVRGGSNISAVEVESVLLEDFAVADAAVVGVRDDELGQRVGAALVLKQGEANTTWQEVLERVRPRLADYKIPEKVLLVDAIPRNALTKIDRSTLASLIENET